jgi:hypothetical protein
MTKHDGARWHANFYTGIWMLKARAQDGGQVLGRIDRRNRVYFWGLGDVQGANVAESLSAAQRAVRKALRENAE